jgi:tetratricopeptide (TPR) repeat protein
MKIQEQSEQFRTRFRQSGANRKEFIQKLIKSIILTKQCKGQMIVISGDAGSGKTLLLDAALEQLSFAKYRTKQISLHEFDSLSPYDPFIQLLPNPSQFQLLQNISSDASGSSESDQLLTQLSQSHTMQKQYGLIQHQLAQQLLDQTKQEATLGIFLHVQEATTTFWQFMHFLSKRIANHPLTLILLVDSSQHEAGDGSWRDALQRMNRERLYMPFKLEALTFEEYKVLLTSVFQQIEFSDRFIHDLHASTHGLPGKLCTILTHLIEHGIVYQSNDVWYHQQLWELPDEKDVIDQSLFSSIWNAMQPLHHSILSGAAFLGDSFDSTLLTELLEHPRLDVLKGLALLSQKGLLPSIDDTRFRFSTGDLRKYCLTMLSTDRQDEWLSHLDNLLLSKAPNSFSFSHTVLVDMHVRLENYHQALEWVDRGMKAAIQHAALWEAYALINRANPFIHAEWPDKPVKQIVAIFTRAAWLARVLGEYNQSLTFSQSALTFATETNEKNHVWIQEGLTYFRMNQWQESLQVLNRALAGNDTNDLQITMMAHFGIGNVKLELSDYDAAKLHYDYCLPLAIKQDDTALLGTLYNNLGIIANIHGQRIQAISLYSKSIPLHEKVGDTIGLARIYNNIGMTYADELQWEKAESFYQKSLAITAQLEARTLRSIALLNHALALINLNRLDDAQISNKKARHILKQLCDQLGLAEYHKIQGIIDRKAKNQTKSEINYMRAHSLYQSLANQLGMAEVSEEFGHLFNESDEPNKAFEWYEKALIIYQSLNLIDKVNNLKQHIERNKVPVAQNTESA